MRWLNRLTPKLIVGAFLAFSLIAYIAYESYNFVLGPELNVDSPQSGEVRTNSLVTVVGHSRRIAKAYLNGKQIFAKDGGRIEESLLLSYGYNIIELKVEDQFGREVKKQIELVLQ